MKTVKKEDKNEIAIIGFICSIFGYATVGLTSIVGLVLSIIGLKKSKELKGKNKIFAIVGILLAILNILAITAFILFILFADNGYSIFGGDHKNDYKIVEQYKYTNEDGNISIDGKLTNISKRKLTYINMTYTTYDAEGNITGTCSAYLDELPKGKTWKFSATCDADARNISKYKLKEVVINTL